MNRTMSKISKVGLVAAVVGLTGLAGAQPASATGYTSRILPLLPGGANCQAAGINENGQVTGTADMAIPTMFNWVKDRAAIWQPDGTVTSLGTLYNGYPNPSISAGNAINNSGHIVGSATKDTSTYPPGAYWDGTTLSELPRQGSNPTAVAYGIRDSNSSVTQAVGYADIFDEKISARPYGRACLWNKSPGTNAGAPVILPTLYASSVAYDINNSGQIVGSSVDNANNTHAVLWSGGMLTTDYGLGQATAINDFGKVVGLSEGKACWWPNGARVNLGPAGTRASGDLTVGAKAIDNQPGDSCRIVGSSMATEYSSSGTPIGNFGHAFLWTSAAGGVTTPTDLAFVVSGYRLIEAVGINNTGQIVCNGKSLTGSSVIRAFVLTPIP